MACPEYEGANKWTPQLKKLMLNWLSAKWIKTFCTG